MIGSIYAGDFNIAVEAVSGYDLRVGAIGGSGKTYVDGRRMECGTATIKYSDALGRVTVNFDSAFNTTPKVFVSQVFNNNNIVVLPENISVTGFTASVDAMDSQGSRDFDWIAIGS